MNRKRKTRGAQVPAGSADSNACPCGSGRAYSACCGPLHAGEPAADAAALMRSRYTAYVMRISTYLLQSWHPSTRPQQIELENEPSPRWVGLELRHHASIGPDTAIVEFLASYRLGGRDQCLHEISRFLREGGRWYYVDGDFPQPASNVSTNGAGPS